MKAIKCIACAMAFVASPGAFADGYYDPDWRDGCPAGNLSQYPDQKYRPDDPLPRYEGTRPELVGALPETDSALGLNQVGIDTTLSHFASTGSAFVRPQPATLLGLATLRAAVNMPIREARRWSFGAHALLSEMHLETAGQAQNHHGNLVLEPELRRQWVGTGSNTIDNLAQTVHQPASLRNGIALQGIFSIPVDNSDMALLTRTVAWSRDAFGGYLVSPHRTWGFALEVRSEGVGCYTPFIHLRLSATSTRMALDPDERNVTRPVYLIPQTLTVGMSVSSHASVLMQYGLLVYIARDGKEDGTGPPSLIETSILHRFRLGGSWVTPKESLTLSGYLDLFAGSKLYSGTVVGLSLTWNMGDLQ